MQESGKYRTVQAVKWAPREAQERIIDGVTIHVMLNTGSAVEFLLSGKCTELDLHWPIEELICMTQKRVADRLYGVKTENLCAMICCSTARFRAVLW